MLTDLKADCNAVRPIASGGTGGGTAQAARLALGLGSLAVSDSIGTGDLDDGAVTAAKVAAGAIGAGKLAPDLANALIPIGGGMDWHRSDDPGPSWLEADGAEYLQSDWPELMAIKAVCPLIENGSDATKFRVKDLRGYGKRVLDGGRGIDPGRTLGSLQQDEFKAHSHVYYRIGLISNGERDNNTQAGQDYNAYNTSTTGGNETRMKNFSHRYFIRAA